MISILQAKIRLFLRKPMVFIGMTAMSLVFAYFLGGSNIDQVAVPVYTNIEDIDSTDLWKELSESDSYELTLMSEVDAKKMVREGDAAAAVELLEDSYKIIITAETPNMYAVQNYIQSVYSDWLLEKNLSAILEGHSNPDPVIERIREMEEKPLFNIEKENFRGNNAVIYNSRLQSLFGLSLFFVIFTIAFNVVNILEEKRQGVWDRMILSPLRKWQMYAGNLVYSFVAGYIQVVLVFCVFKYLAGVDFYDGFGKTLVILLPYVFSIVAISMFIAGLAKSTQQFNAVIPLVSVSMAMIGGAYWPLEIVTSNILLKLSNLVPITYAMEAMKEATIYGSSLADVAYPMLILVLIGVVFIGLGIGLIERRNV